MNKKLLLIVLCGFAQLIYAQTWINLGSSTPKGISATVTESNSQSIRVLFASKGFNSESINEGNTIYQRISIPRAGNYQIIGFPELPSFRQMVAIPECSNVSLSFQVLQEQVLNNYNVYPAPDYRVITNPDSTCYVTEVFNKNALCYTDNLLFPANNAELTEIGYFRSQKYAEIHFEWLPFWTMAKSGEGQTESEMLYEQAVQDFEDSLYVKAKSEFLHVISEYPRDWVAISALKELFRLESYLDNDYSSLKSYYLTNETIQQESALKQLGGFLSARCDVNMKKYEDALEWYIAQFSDENLTYQDSVFYIIDIGDIYYLMGEDSICRGNLPIWFKEHKEVLPKSIIEHEKNTKQLLSTLPFNNKEIKVNLLASGEFYSFTGWEDSCGGSGIRCLAHYTEHGKKVELPYSYLIDEPEAMGIGDLITDATTGVLYNKDGGDGQTNKLYRSMDYGHTWEAIDDLSGNSDGYWTFKNAPGVLLRSNPEELKISYDYGSHFEVMGTPALKGYNVAGWNVGEFFNEDYSCELSSYYLTHSLDFNQTVDSVYYPESNLNMMSGAKEGELFTYYPSYDDPNHYIMSYKLFFSPDYGQNHQMVMTVDSLIIGDVYVTDSWEFIVDREPGVFYSIKRENSIIHANSGKIWIDYFRDYGETLVTTYFHHFRPNWHSQHSPVMDCEVADFDENGVTLSWNEPELKPNEVLVGYQVYRGENLIGDLITETEYTDHYSYGGRLKYHVLAVYGDGETSKSYNIVYCEQTQGIHKNDAGTSVAIFPNPTSVRFTVKSQGIVQVEVYDMVGRRIAEQQGEDVGFDVSGWNKGIYLVRVVDRNGVVAARKLMVR